MKENQCPIQEIRDFGAEPIAVSIEKITKQNQTYRTALWTGNKLQVTVMCIPAEKISVLKSTRKPSSLSASKAAAELRLWANAKTILNCASGFPTDMQF